MSDKLQGGILAGSTSVSLPVILRKTTDNTEQTGKVAADITAYYWRQGGTPTALTAATDLAAITSAFSAGGWKAADATNQPGAYRLDVDNAAFATGADWVIVSVKVTGCYVFYEKYALTTNVVQTGDSFARIGANGAGLTGVTGVTLAASQHVIVDSGTVTTVTNQLTAAQIATGVWQDSTAGDFTTASSIGKSLYTSGVVPGAAGGVFIAGSNAATTVNFTGTITTATNLTTNNDKTGYAVSATGLDLYLVSGQKPSDALRHIGAAVCGKISGAGTGTEVFLDFGGGAALTVTVDASGNRSNVVYA